MRHPILRWIFEKYRSVFFELFVEDMYGYVPEKFKKPSVDFLVNCREKLIPFFSLQAYEMNRRAINDPKNAQVYHGILVHIRSLISLIEKGEKPEASKITPEPKDDSLAQAESFLSEAKKRFYPEKK